MMSPHNQETHGAMTPTSGRLMWTIDDMLAERPCPYYDRVRVTELWDGRHGLTLGDILELEIPVTDRLWVVARSGIAVPWTERIVTRAVTTHVLSCGIPAVECWAVRWLDGTDCSAKATWAARPPSRNGSNAGASSKRSRALPPACGSSGRTTRS